MRIGYPFSRLGWEKVFFRRFVSLPSMLGQGEGG
jgi:hypothetical protein